MALRLADIPSITALYRTGKTLSQAVKVPNAVFNEKIAIITHDITKLKVDAIVNAANTSLLGGGGVDGAIHAAAGRGLLNECKSLNGCAVGGAKVTDAYALPCKKVIHTVGPQYSQSQSSTGIQSEQLRSCYRNCLELAVANDLRSIAFSAISTGIYGYPKVEAAEIAIGEVRRFLDSGEGDTLEKIIFCNFSQPDYDIYLKEIP